VCRSRGIAASGPIPRQHLVWKRSPPRTYFCSFSSFSGKGPISSSMRASRRAPRSHLLRMLVAESNRTRTIAVTRTAPNICPWGELVKFRKFDHEVPTCLGYEADEAATQMSKTMRVDTIPTTSRPIPLREPRNTPDRLYEDLRIKGKGPGHEARHERGTRASTA